MPVAFNWWPGMWSRSQGFFFCCCCFSLTLKGCKIYLWTLFANLKLNLLISLNCSYIIQILFMFCLLIQILTAVPYVWYHNTVTLSNPGAGWRKKSSCSDRLPLQCRSLRISNNGWKSHFINIFLLDPNYMEASKKKMLGQIKTAGF